MAEVEFEVGSFKYRAMKMDAFTQFHLARKLAPVLLPVVESLGADMDFKSLATGGADKFMAFAGPVIDVIGRMPDDEANYIIFTCLGVVQRQSGPGWQPILTGPQGGARGLMFEDITVQIMLQLVWKVLEANTAGFFHEVPLTSPAPIPE